MFEHKNIENLSTEEQFRIILDEREITNVINRYARAASRGDFDLFKSCFFDDAMDHHAPSFEGKIIDFYETFREAADKVAESGQYYMCNLLIDLDGDVAHTECQAFSPKILHQRSYNGDKVMRIAGSRYLHRFERRDRQWRIAECWWVYEWSFYKEVPPQLQAIGPFAAPADMRLTPLTSRRDREDISYRFKAMGKPAAE